FEEEIFEAGAIAALAEDFAVAEDFGDGADNGDALVFTDESVQADGEVRFGGKAAGYAEGRAEGVIRDSWVVTRGRGRGRARAAGSRGCGTGGVGGRSRSRSPQGLKPIVRRGCMSGLKLRPPERSEEGFLRSATRGAKSRRGRKSRVAAVGMTGKALNGCRLEAGATKRAEGGSEGDVVDFGIGAPVGAGGDGDFEFAREIVEIGIAGELLIDGESDGRDVGDFACVETGERAASDVAGDIAAGAGGAEADAVQLVEEVGEGFDADPVELDVLADGDVGNAIAVAIGEIGDGVELTAGEEAVGDAYAHHEEGNGATFTARAANDAEAVTLGVNAPGPEIGGEPFGRNGRVAAAGEIADGVEVQPGIHLALEALDALGLGFLEFGHVQLPVFSSQ